MVLIISTKSPHGERSFQLFIEAEFEQHWFTLREDPRQRARLQKICVWNFVANNADRKNGHCLLGPDNLIYGIDNGLTFHTDMKLRTVIWDYAGEPIQEGMLEDLKRFVKDGLPEPLADLLDAHEQQALRVRAQADYARFPEDRSGHRYPWPRCDPYSIRSFPNNDPTIEGLSSKIPPLKHLFCILFRQLRDMILQTIGNHVVAPAHGFSRMSLRQ